jgi:hypothetical protein
MCLGKMIIWGPEWCLSNVYLTIHIFNLVLPYNWLAKSNNLTGGNNYRTMTSINWDSIILEYTPKLYCHHMTQIIWSQFSKLDLYVYIEDLGHSNCTACDYRRFCSLLYVFVACDIHVNIKIKVILKTWKKYFSFNDLKCLSTNYKHFKGNANCWVYAELLDRFKDFLFLTVQVDFNSVFVHIA